MKKISVVLSFVISMQIGLLKTTSFKSKSDEEKEAEDYSLLDTHSLEFVKVINEFKTYSQNPITFNDDERLMLTSSTTYSKFNVEGKEKVLKKFNNKVQEIKCTNAVIAQTILQHSKAIINVSFNSESERVTKIKLVFYKLKIYLARMLSVLFIAKTVSPNWLWLLYFRVYGVVDAETEKFTVPDANYLVGNNELNADIAKCIHKCENIYLDEYYVDVNSLVVPIRSMDDIDVLMDRMFKPHDHTAFKYAYRHQQDFTISNLYLQELWDNHALLFEEIPGVLIDWAATVSDLDAANILMRNHVANRMWVKQPFRVKIYLELIVNIVIVRLYLYSWTHLAAYRKASATCSKEHSVKINQDFHLLFKSAAEAIRYKDEFMDELIEFLNFYYRDEIDTNQLTTMSMRIKKKADLILNDFNINQWSLTDDKPGLKLLENNSAALQKYLENIKKTLRHTNIELILYFLNGERYNE
ncbi:uncharacterized protein LOC126844520 [Adelges cooleyi]|uniref:uncharacterized protein LOC126844520 n=1 Tax=Adelges cooleyi TaxID=133065 RepID=UPI00217F876D|nr:uncharacterized protein LOC126844520 [Adelges cooleyi]